LFSRVVSLMVLLVACADSPERSAVNPAYLAAKVLYSQGKIDEAAKALEALLARDGSMAPARLLYGRALYFQRDYPRAKRVLEALQTDHPESVEASLWLVRTLMQLHSFEAESLLARLLAVNPDDPRLAYQMALIREQKNDLPGARGFLLSAAAADEDLALVHFEAARVAFQLHNAGVAQAEITRALGFLDPSSLLRKPLERLQADLNSRGRL